MRVFVSLLFAVLLLSPLPRVSAQGTVVDPQGRWEGVVKLPSQDLRVVFDLARNAKGELAGTFSQPEQGVKGLPFSTVTATGRSVELLLKAGPQPSTFTGEISADGKTLAGSASQGGDTAGFSLTRTGDAQIAAAPKNAAIGKEFVGTWNGTLELGERQMRIILKMLNQPDGAAKGTIMSPDGSGVEIAVSLKQKDASLSVEAASVGASYAGTLNAAGTELAGSWTQGGSTLPLTFRRAATR